jgi:prephenate dehydratase
MAASEANTAAIASTMCAKLYGLIIIEDDIQDQLGNNNNNNILYLYNK